jgi:hypothetical protein
VDVWYKFWAYTNVPGGVNPVWPGHASYPWSNTGHSAYSVAPLYIGEIGTGNADTDLSSTTRGSQGQWFTDMVNFVQSSRDNTPINDSGIAVSNIHHTYWALNDEDAYAILGAGYTGLKTQRSFILSCATFNLAHSQFRSEVVLDNVVQPEHYQRPISTNAK